MRTNEDWTGCLRSMAHFTLASGTNRAIARANSRLAVRLVSLAGTGIDQQGPSMSSAISAAAAWMAASVGTLIRERYGGQRLPRQMACGSRVRRSLVRTYLDSSERDQCD